MISSQTAVSPRILVVEDDRAYRRLLDCDVRSAGDGDDAFLAPERERGWFDLVPTRDDMLGMSGRDLRDEQIRRRPGMRTVFLTTRDDDRLGALPQLNSVDAAIETLAAALSGRAAVHDLQTALEDAASPTSKGGP